MSGSQTPRTVKGKGVGKGQSKFSRPESSTSVDGTRVQYNKLLIYDFGLPLDESLYNPVAIIEYNEVESVVKQDYLLKKLVKRRRTKTFSAKILGRSFKTPFRILSKIDSRISRRDLDKLKSATNHEVNRLVRSGMNSVTEVYSMIIGILNAKQIQGMSKLPARYN